MEAWRSGTDQASPQVTGIPSELANSNLDGAKRRRRSEQFFTYRGKCIALRNLVTTLKVSYLDNAWRCRFASLTCGLQNASWTRYLRDFHRAGTQSRAQSRRRFVLKFSEKPRGPRVWPETRFGICTVSGHRLVDGLHSTEKTCTYKRIFLID